MRRHAAALIALGLWMCALPEARAETADQTAVGNAGDPSGDVKKLHNDALEAYKRGDWATAYEGFDAAWKIQHLPRIAGNLGRTEMKLQKYRDAATHLAIYLREEGEIADAERRQVGALLEEAKAQVGTIAIAAEPGAEVLVDGVVVGTSPLGHDVYAEPGAHRFEARMAGRQIRQDVGIKAGDGVFLKLQPTTPPGPLVGKGGDAPAATPQESSSTRTVLIWTGGALAGASLVVGSVLLSVSSSKVSEVEESLDDLPRVAGPSGPICTGPSATICANNVPKLEVATNLRTGGTVALITGGALAVGTLGYAWLSGRNEPRVGGIEIVPAAGTAEAGVRIQGVW